MTDEQPKSCPICKGKESECWLARRICLNQKCGFLCRDRFWNAIPRQVVTLEDIERLPLVTQDNGFSDMMSQCHTIGINRKAIRALFTKKATSDFINNTQSAHDATKKNRSHLG